MTRSRLARVLLTGLVAAGLTAAATDPAWARSLGVDVWNLRQVEDARRAAAADRAALDDAADRMFTRHRMNELLVRDVIDGRCRLAVAADRMWAVNGAVPGYADILRMNHAGPTAAAVSAHNVIARASAALRDDPYRRAVVLARLGDEYRAAYGVPAPRE